MKKSLIWTGVAVLVVLGAGLALWGVKFGQDNGSGAGTSSTIVPGGGENRPSGGDKPAELIGGQRDEHGCLIPAGFAWNQTAEKCMRPWSGEVQSGGGNSSGVRACTKEALVCPNGSSVGRDPENNCEFAPCPEGKLDGGQLVGGQRDEHGCLIPAGYSWNETAGKCMRPWSGEAQVETHVCTEEEKQNNACTMDYRPVCGSDAVTYGNGCAACSSKVESWTEGECTKTSRVCGRCPEYSPPAPGWCRNGTIASGKLDACGCRGPPQCVKG